MNPFLRKSSLPADVRARIADHLGARPRVLAWASTVEGGVVAALIDRLVLVREDGIEEMPWHDVLRGGFDGEGRSMRWTRMSTEETTVLPLVEPNSFPEVFKERVEATFLFQQAVFPKPGRAVTISARRNLTDADAPVIWTAHPARGVVMDDEMLGFTEAELARLRAEYAF